MDIWIIKGPGKLFSNSHTTTGVNLEFEQNLTSTISSGKRKRHRRVFISLIPTNCCQIKSLPTELLQVFTVHNKLLTRSPRGQRVRQDNNIFTFCKCVSNVSCQTLPKVEQRNVSGSSITICPGKSSQNLTTSRVFPWKRLSFREVPLCCSSSIRSQAA